MPISTGAGLAIAGGIGAAGSVAGGLLQSNAAQGAASTQAGAAEYAAQLQAEMAQEALQFQEQEYSNSLGLEEPNYLSGIGAESTLDQLMGLPAVSANTSIFQNPLGNLSSNAIPNTINIPGAGNLPLGSLGSNTNTGIRPIAQQQALPQNQTAAVPTASGNQNLPLSTLAASANVEGLTAPGFQGGPVFSPTQGPISLSTAGNALQGTNQGLPLSALSSFIPGSFTNNPGSIGPLPAQGVGPQQGPISGGVLSPVVAANGNPAQTTVAAPATAAGTAGTTGLPLGYLTQTFNTPFVPPTAQQAAQTPGEQFELQQGLQALDNSAAAKGTLLTGGTGKAEQQYGQSLASTNYQQAYNNALTNYQTAYNVFNNNQTNLFNRLATLAGYGQTSANQLSATGANAANSFSNTLLGAGSQIGSDAQSAAAALASGEVGSANAISGGLSSLGSLGALLPFLLQQNAANSAGSSGASSSNPLAGFYG